MDSFGWRLTASHRSLLIAYARGALQVFTWGVGDEGALGRKVAEDGEGEPYSEEVPSLVEGAIKGVRLVAFAAVARPLLVLLRMPVLRRRLHSLVLSRLC